MLSQTFWVEYLYRRVKVFDQNDEFNYNETCDHLGSSLMRIMLHEAEQLLSKNQNKSWKESNHEQLIYDFSNPKSPKFRLICTASHLMHDDVKERYTKLELPGFVIPTDADLCKREVLDRFLSQAIDVPLTKTQDGREALICVDENKFVLTLDFTMKLLNMHERVSCHIPCIIEGETGVSKTALTKMYSILRNSALKADAEKMTQKALKSIGASLNKKGILLQSESNCQVERILKTLRNESDGTLSGTTELGSNLFMLIKELCGERSSIFQKIPELYEKGNKGDTLIVSQLLEWFADSVLEKTFFEINVDSSLTQDNIVQEFEVIRATARKIFDSKAIVVVFLDGKFNSDVLKLMCILPHSLFYFI